MQQNTPLISQAPFQSVNALHPKCPEGGSAHFEKGFSLVGFSFDPCYLNKTELIRLNVDSRPSANAQAFSRRGFGMVVMKECRVELRASAISERDQRRSPALVGRKKLINPEQFPLLDPISGAELGPLVAIFVVRCWVLVQDEAEVRVSVAKVVDISRANNLYKNWVKFCGQMKEVIAWKVELNYSDQRPWNGSMQYCDSLKFRERKRRKQARRLSG